MPARPTSLTLPTFTVPPGATHVDGVTLAAPFQPWRLVIPSAVAASLRVSIHGDTRLVVNEPASDWTERGTRKIRSPLLFGHFLVVIENVGPDSVTVTPVILGLETDPDDVMSHDGDRTVNRRTNELTPIDLNAVDAQMVSMVAAAFPPADS